MTASDLRRAIALCRAAGHTTVPVPFTVLTRLLAAEKGQRHAEKTRDRQTVDETPRAPRGQARPATT